MSGPRTLFRGIGFFGFLGFFFFWFSSSFFDFWLRKLLSATRTTNNPKTSRKTKKNRKKHSVLRNVWAPFFRCSGVLCVFLFFCFVVFLFLFFGCGSRPPPPENKPILLQTLSPINLSSIGFLLCSMLRVAVAKKSTNQGHEG